MPALRRRSNEGGLEIGGDDVGIGKIGAFCRAFVFEPEDDQVISTVSSSLKEPVQYHLLLMVLLSVRSVL